ncbi:hypothetical protein EW146_g2500 [Bondarzewia mesenterica]|uniref:RRM domain-containing protein n=1 Tax=Bondarzewia mesenterica TaxID=1095465 RepID=A0A4S4M6L9_9AGAM|nr:hypothetical protein EW146_g2500 [Bondarzewia mesenterica]
MPVTCAAKLPNASTERSASKKYPHAPSISSIMSTPPVMRGVARLIRDTRNHSPIHIKLSGLPRTALPSDIRRMLSKHQVENVIDVALDYYRFQPSGSAWLTVSHRDFLRRAIVMLRNSTLFGLPISADTAREPIGPPARSRGEKGRMEGARRGLVNGNGSRGGIWETGKSVVVWGMPGRIATDGMRSFLRSYKLVPGEGDIVKLES